MREQYSYYVMLGGRYIIYPEHWLEVVGGDLCLERNPSERSAIAHGSVAWEVVKKILASDLVSAADKKKIKVQRIQVTDFLPPSNIS